MDRIADLKRAEQLLNEAADLIDSSLRMSGMESRTGDSTETIRRIASDKDDAGSLRNIILDMEYREREQPLWTQPLTSPKHQFELKKDE
jgi:hypothetical protein